MKILPLPALLAVVGLSLTACHRPAQAAPAPAAHPAAYHSETVAHGGAIAGAVHLQGPAPAAQPQVRNHDLRTCGTDATDPSLVIGKGGEVANAVVTLDVDHGKKLAPTPNAVLDQKGCTYEPHVQAVTVGTQLTLLNGDPVLHNAHGYLHDDTVFNKAQPLQDRPGMPRKSVRLDTPGPIHVRCDVHSWMSAWVDVVQTPYFAVTGPDGTFHIGDIPPGTYTLKVWHERLAPASVKVTVPADGTAQANVSLKAR